MFLLFTAFELFFLGLCLIFLVGGAFLDRKGEPVFKWFFAFVAIAIGIWVFAPAEPGGWASFSASFTAFVSTVFSLQALKYLGIYLAFGVLYTPFEFFMTTSKLSRRVAEHWKKQTDKTEGGLRAVVNHFYASYSWLKLKGDVDMLDGAGRIPFSFEIDKPRLTIFAIAWVFWWPFYALSLLLNDFVREIFRVVIDAISARATAVVNAMLKRAFSNA